MSTSTSWIKHGGYSWGKLSKDQLKMIEKFKL